MSKRLTPKAAKFVQEYLIDMNASAAALRAGYSEKTAHAIGWENLRKPEIQEALQIARQELSVKTGITPEMVIQGFANGAFADLAECYDEQGNLKGIHDIPKPVRMAIAGLEVDEIYAGSGEDRCLIGHTKKLKMWEKHKNLDSLAKHFGLYDADRSNQTNVKFIVCGTAGKSLEETMEKVGVVEIQSE